MVVSFYQTTRQVSQSSARPSSAFTDLFLYLKKKKRFLAHRTLVDLMIEAVRTCETLVNLYHSTRRYNPEDGHLNLRILGEENVNSFLYIGHSFEVMTF
jgi:hypothetical protein